MHFAEFAFEGFNSLLPTVVKLFFFVYFFIYQNLRSRFGIERYAYTESHIGQIPCVCMYVCM